MRQNKKGMLGFLFNPTFWVIAGIIFIIYFGFIRTAALTPGEAISQTCAVSAISYDEKIENSNTGDERRSYLTDNWINDQNKQGYSGCKLYGGAERGGILAREDGLHFVGCCEKYNNMTASNPAPIQTPGNPSSGGIPGASTTSKSFLDKVTIFVQGIINKILGVFGVQ